MECETSIGVEAIYTINEPGYWANGRASPVY